METMMGDYDLQSVPLATGMTLAVAVAVLAVTAPS